MQQNFRVYFVKDTSDYAQKARHGAGVEALSMPVSDMRSESDILQERIEKDLLAFGEFSAQNLMEHSVNPDDFTNLDSTAGA